MKAFPKYISYCYMCSVCGWMGVGVWVCGGGCVCVCVCVFFFLIFYFVFSVHMFFVCFSFRNLVLLPAVYRSRKHEDIK